MTAPREDPAAEDRAVREDPATVSEPDSAAADAAADLPAGTAADEGPVGEAEPGAADLPAGTAADEGPVGEAGAAAAVRRAGGGARVSVAVAGGNGARPGGGGGEPPAHARGGVRVVRGERDRRSLLVRLPVVVALALVVAAGVAYDAGRTADLATASGGVTAGGAAAGPAAAVPAGMPVARPASAGSSTWYCAAGTARNGGSADHVVVVANPTDRPRRATLTVVPGGLSGSPPAGAGGGAVVRQVEVPARQRATVRLGDEVQAPLAAAIVEVDGGGVAVEHRVSGPYGSDIGPCSPFTAATWHLAWGTTTRDARDLVVLFNPFPSAATVDASFVAADGRREPVRWQGFPVPARSVVGVELTDDVARSGQVAATFRARTGRVVVERIAQFDGSLGVRGMSLDLAVPDAGTEGTVWAFADGGATAPTPVAAAPGSDDPAARTGLAASEKIVVYNPGADRAEVEVQVVPGAADAGDDEAPEPFRLSVGPGGYDVVDLGAEARVPPGGHHATLVRSTNGVPVVAERVTTDVFTPRTTSRRSRARTRTPPPGSETTATPGALLAATGWTFAAVDAGDGVTTSIALYNPDPDRAVRVRIEGLPAADAVATTDGAPPVPIEAEVAPGGRTTVALPPDAGAGLRAAVVRADGPVVAERLLRSEDGRRQALGPGIPDGDGTRPLAELVAGITGRDDR
jgi:hypothetical protein